MTTNRSTAFSTALSFFDGLRTKDLPANLLQAQRDYFGAHTFRIKQEYASAKYPEGKVRVETKKCSHDSNSTPRTSTSIGPAVVAI